MSSHDAIMAKLDGLKEDAEEIKTLQRETNGRLREAEKAIATHWTLWRILGAAILAAIPVIYGIVMYVNSH